MTGSVQKHDTRGGFGPHFDNHDLARSDILGSTPKVTTEYPNTRLNVVIILPTPIHSQLVIRGTTEDRHRYTKEEGKANYPHLRFE